MADVFMSVHESYRPDEPDAVIVDSWNKVYSPRGLGCSWRSFLVLGGPLRHSNTLAVKIPSEALEAAPVNDFETLRGSEKRLQ